MKALRMHDPAKGAAGLVYEDAPDPEPAIGEVLVKVHAGGITPTEQYWPTITSDRYQRERQFAIPGHEISGVVTAVGFGVAGIAVGDEVFALTDGYRDGSAAEYESVEARDLALKPKTIDHTQAAALPQGALTGWQALFDHGNLEAGQTVIIHGAGGAVGGIAVQLAAAAGAHVIGTGRASAKARVLELGAERFVDLENDKLDELAGTADLVFDTIGGDVLVASGALVRNGGKVVSVVAPAPPGAEDAVVFIRHPDGKQLAEIAKQVDAGQLKPHVSAVYPLSEGSEAFQAQERGEVSGKVILQP